jgi:hypothetical protein
MRRYPKPATVRDNADEAYKRGVGYSRSPSGWERWRTYSVTESGSGRTAAHPLLRVQ